MILLQAPTKPQIRYTIPQVNSRLVLLVALYALLLSCTRPQESPRATQHAPRYDARANDVARFLAGMPGRPNGPFHSLESNPAWRRHKQTSDRLWSRFEQNRLPAMRAFQQREIAGPAFSGDLVFYPFGGPDALTVTTLFPKRLNYLLIGLEPPGSLPPEERILAANLDRQLPQMVRTVESLLHRSFFITASMDRQMRGQITDGLLPVILVQLVRSGFTIVSHEPVTLNEAGEFHQRVAADKRNRGVRIEFRNAAGEPGHLIYLSANLNNNGLAANSALRAFLTRSHPAVTFFKSSSYMPHRPDFSSLRQFVLDNSRTIVQDDSGIPYRFLDPAHWDARLYGRYTQPYGSFRGLMQRDLRKAYERHAAPLDFPIGYGFGRAPSALQIFLRKS